MKKFNNKFRICNFTIYQEDMLNNQVIKLYENNCDKEEKDIFTSIIIGENGTGKSKLLHVISEVFIELSEIKEERKFNSKIKYTLEYIIDNKKIYIDKSTGPIKAYINGKCVNLSEILLPNQVICSSFLLNDKFRFKGQEEDKYPIYEYQGIKATRSLGNSKTLVKRTANNIIKSSHTTNFMDKFRKLMDFINLGHEIDLVYEIRSKKEFFEGYMNKSIFINELDETLNRRKHTPFWKNKYEDLKKNNKINDIVDSLNSDKFKKTKFNNKNCIKYTINLGTKIINEKIVQDLEIIQQLMSLDILSSPSIIVNKLGKKYSLVDGSSGEGNLIFTLVNILAKIKENSLVLIDEPEISLHPNWQIKYIHLLKELLKDYYNCHIIIATHSHFMVSDIDKKSSSLTILKNEGGKIVSYTNDGDTYGWSAENILYNVFGVPTNRNYYLANEIDDILNDLSTGKNNNQTKAKLKKIIHLKDSLLDSDPLKSIIGLIEERVNE